MTDEPKQKDLLTGRWRKVQDNPVSESKIQAAVWEHFKQRKAPKALGFHPANGEKRDIRTGAKLKSMGLVPGVSDLVFVWNDPNNPWGQDRLRVLFLELKAKGGRQSDNQKLWEQEVIRVDHDDCNYAIATGVDEAVNILLGYGIIR